MGTFQKWSKKHVFGGVVVELSLLMRPAGPDDLSLSALSVQNLVKKLSTHLWRRYKKRTLDKIDMVVVHHSATATGTAEAYARYHVSNNGWPGIGYHFVIDKDGTIHQTNELETISYHVSGQNTNSIGICLTGDYDRQKPPEEQLNKCAQLIAMLRQQIGRPLKIRGHAAFSTKTCPGLHFNMEEIVRRVNAYENPTQA